MAVAALAATPATALASPSLSLSQPTIANASTQIAASNVPGGDSLTGCQLTYTLTPLSGGPTTTTENPCAGGVLPGSWSTQQHPSASLVTVTAVLTAQWSDGSNQTSATSNTITIPQAPAFTSPTTIAGQIRNGATLTGVPGTLKFATNTTFEWLVNGQLVQDGPDQFTLAPGDAGATIQFVVVATNAYGFDYGSMTLTAGTEPSLDPSSPPALSGPAQPGGVLTASTGAWQGVTSYVY